jgi:type VI secretion system secreted protein Hcp
MFVVILALVTVWMVVTDRAGAASAPATPTMQAEEVMNALLALQENGNEGGQIFAKYDGIDGESVDANHDKWIDVLSYEWGAHRDTSTAGTTRRRGAAVVEGFVLSFDYEKASPKLEEKLLRGEVIPKLEVELTSTYGGARATYLKYELKNVQITDYEVDGAAGYGPPSVSFVNSFEEIKVTYTEYDDEGSSQGNVEYSFKVEG